MSPRRGEPRRAGTMDFESPDVERDFPGLYASESGSGKRSQDSDFSDDAHDRSTKKELLIGKRKDKKESKKDQGYAALEGESSPEEDLDVKSPCKSKKSKSFKFPTIKEKREKSREKDSKEKDKDKDKDKEKDKDKDTDRDKEKRKELKSKLKLKDKKKVKVSEDVTESVEEMPVFGVPLSVAVDRSHCHDGIEIPVVVRNCIDHVQDYGLATENIYKISGIKSKVQQLRRSYNKREMVNLCDYDVPTVTSLLKSFLRDLPEPILTTELTPKFEDIACVKELAAREQELASLLLQVPTCNLTCLSWILRHLENVTANESQNKMSISALGSVFGPVFQTSTRVVTALLSHCGALFPNVKLVRYIPPLSSGCTSLPNTREAIAAELIKQDSLLNQIHSEMNHGYTVRSEELWEVQRFITLLKRKLRSLEKAQEASSQAVDKVDSVAEKSEHSATAAPSTTLSKIAPISPSNDKIDFQLQVATEEGHGKGGKVNDAEEGEIPCEGDEISPKDVAASPEPQPPTVEPTTEPTPTPSSVEQPIQDAVANVPDPCDPAPVSATVSTTVTTIAPATASAAASDQSDNTSCSELEEKSQELCLEFEHIELMKLQNFLLSRLSDEREKLDELRAELKLATCAQSDSSVPITLQPDSDGNELVEIAETNIDKVDGEWEDWTSEKLDLYKKYEKLMADRLNLVRQIMIERESCVSLKVQVEQLKQLADAT